jgi:hypothetical protein
MATITLSTAASPSAQPENELARPDRWCSRVALRQTALFHIRVADAVLATERRAPRWQLVAALPLVGVAPPLGAGKRPATSGMS